jgi:hypothetical protein
MNVHTFKAPRLCLGCVCKHSMLASPNLRICLQSSTTCMCCQLSRVTTRTFIPGAAAPMHVQAHVIWQCMCQLSCKRHVALLTAQRRRRCASPPQHVGHPTCTICACGHTCVSAAWCRYNTTVVAHSLNTRHLSGICHSVLSLYCMLCVVMG